MQSKKKLLQLKYGLPYGGLKELSKRTGLTRVTVYNIFEGKKANMQNVIKVVTESKKIISEFQELTGISANA